MSHTTPRGTLLDVPLLEERYGPAFGASIAIHVLVVAFFLVAPFLIPDLTPIQIGTGPGGGSGGESYVVGVADDLGGGAGLYKPAVSASSPAPPVETPAKKEVRKVEPPSKAVPIPEASAPSRKKAAAPSPKTAKKSAPLPTGVIPDADAKGAGGSGGAAGGTGGGRGGGVGVSIGSGSGGIGDSWYARTVEARVGSNWIRPVGSQQRIEIIYSFVVLDDGRIDPGSITKEKSSGNEALDLTAYRAIYVSSPLTQPPPELRGRSLKFVCQFVYPPND